MNTFLFTVRSHVFVPLDKVWKAVSLLWKAVSFLWTAASLLWTAVSLLWTSLYVEQLSGVEMLPSSGGNSRLWGKTVFILKGISKLVVYGRLNMWYSNRNTQFSG